MGNLLRDSLIFGTVVGVVIILFNAFYYGVEIAPKDAVQAWINGVVGALVFFWLTEPKKKPEPKK